MKHYGDRPPWDGESRYGFWRWIPPSYRDWFDGPGYWQWYPPDPSWGSPLWHLTQTLKGHYVDVIKQTMNGPFLLMSGLAEEVVPQLDAA